MASCSYALMLSHPRCHYALALSCSHGLMPACSQSPPVTYVQRDAPSLSRFPFLDNTGFENRAPVKAKRSFLKIKVSSYISFVRMSRTGASGHIILARMSRTMAFGHTILVRMSRTWALGGIILVRMSGTGALGRIILAKMCRTGGVRARFIVNINGFAFQSADYIAILDGSKLPSGK